MKRLPANLYCQESRLLFLKATLIVLLSVALCLPVLWADDHRVVVSDVGFATPESLEYYAAKDLYLVSNINGTPNAEDGNGFISKIAPDGRVLDLKWIDGSREGVRLDSPKGLAILNNQLYVADRNYVHVFTLPDGKPKASVEVKGSTFLNGITAGKGDFVYVTDSGLKEGADGQLLTTDNDAIYKVWASGQYKMIIQDKEMGRPNGILAQDDGLLVVSFGSGAIYRIDAAGKRHALPSPPKGNLDGLIQLDDGRRLISSWGESAVYAMHPDNTYSIFASDLDAPADLGFDTKRQRLLIPLFKKNQLVFLPVQ